MRPPVDAQAEHIQELVAEACGMLDRVGRVGRGVADDAAHGELQQLRGLLRALSHQTGDAQAADTACSVVADIDAALRWSTRSVVERLAG